MAKKKKAVKKTATAKKKPVKKGASNTSLSVTPSRNKPRPEVLMVAIGASAGGLEPYEHFFDSMPVNSGIAFVVIQHLSPNFESMMDELLSRHSSMDIKRVVDDLEVEPNTIYLNPPRSKMIVKNGRFELTANLDVRQLNLPIDIFFESLAREYEERAIAVVLSGTGSDGTRGAAAVKEHNGIVLVQSPESAKFDGMPRSVIESGNCDAIASASELPRLIKRIQDGKSLVDPDGIDVGDDPAQFVFYRLREKYGTDFGYYKKATIQRRFERRAQLTGMDLVEYAKRLNHDSDELDALYADLLIDVTSFFRDPEAFQSIIEHAVKPLGQLMTHDKQIRVWIPGCSSGEEPYSFAIAFAEYARENNCPLNIKILATDIHQRSLGAAAEGIYPKSSLKGLTEEQIDRYFEKHVDYYQVKQHLRRLVVFSQHNLLRDPPYTRMDLVSCRNVLIYFQEQAQQKTLALFHFALKVNGIMFLGSSESLGKLEGEFEQLDRRWKIYQKIRDVRLMEATSLLPRDSANRPRNENRAPYLMGRAGTAQRFQKAHGDALELMLKRFAPSGFLLNRAGEIIHVFGTAGEFVRVDGGMFSNRIIDLIDPDLRLAVTAGLERLTTAEKLEFERRVIISKDNSESQSVIVSLMALSSTGGNAEHFLLTLAVAKPVGKTDEPLPKFLDTNETASILQQRIFDLEQDLTSTEESLQALVEELQTSNEELQATNEELMASNEELQSTNEELHSVNEELYTVSAEHQRKIDELTMLTDDMNLLLKATEIGIIFLDDKFNIRRFTPSATSVFNLLGQDIGRPFAHTTYRFDNVNMMSEIERVQKARIEYSEQLSVEGKDYILRIVPYQTPIANAQGVVITLVDVSDFKTTERARLMEQEIFKTAINDMADEITRVDLETGLVVLANEALANSHGKNVDEIVGRRLADLVGREAAEKTFEFAKTQPAGEIYKHEVIEYAGTPRERVMARSMRVIDDGNETPIALQATAQNVTAAHEYKEVLEMLLSLGEYQLVDIEKSMMSILSIGCKYLGLPRGIISKSVKKKNIVEYCVGYNSKELSRGDVLPKAYEPNLLETNDNAAMGDKQNTSEGLLQDLSGSGAQEYSLSIAVKTQTQVGYEGVLSFSSDEKRERRFSDVEQSIVHLLGQAIATINTNREQINLLELRKVELENLNEGLNRFTYLASHDLQEPLRKIQQSGELLQTDYEKDLDEDGQYFLKIMTQSANRMRSLIDDLLLYSSSANQEIKKTPTSLRDLIDGALTDLSAKVTETEAVIDIKALPTVACDGTVMQQVFLNILSNSIKYRKDGVAPNIKVSSKKLKKETRIYFKDNGIGMNLDESVNILDPFVRLHSKHEYSGSGIGLALCKSICDRHGWTIEIQSEIDKGAQITLKIPNDQVL